jgi:hypothetical protein
VALSTSPGIFTWSELRELRVTGREVAESPPVARLLHDESQRDGP